MGRTKEKLLETAVKVFAEHGYRNATIAEICERAEVNIASVNYHFGSKENLFRLSLRHAFDWAEARFPIRGNQSEEGSPEGQLIAFMDSMIRRGLDSGEAGLFNRIIAHEVRREAMPDEIVVSELNDLQGEFLEGVISKIINTRSKALIRQARLNVVWLCGVPHPVCRLKGMLLPENPSPTAIKQYIERQAGFALAGLKAMVEQGGAVL